MRGNIENFLKITFHRVQPRVNDTQIKQKVNEKIWYARKKKKKKTCTTHEITTFSSSANQCQENWIHNLDNISDIRQVDTKYLLKDLDFMDSKILMKNSQNGSTKTGLNFTSPFFFLSLSLFPKLREKIPEEVLFKLEP